MRFPADLLRRGSRSVVVLLLVLAAFAPSGAFASGADKIWQDCGADAVVNGHYSQSDYADALKNPPADAAEYSDCLNAIRQAQVRDSQSGGSSNGSGSGGSGTTGGSGGSGTSGGSTVAPSDLSNALKSTGIDPATASSDSTPDAPEPVTVDGEKIDLSSGRLPSFASALSLPLPIAASAVVVLLSAGLPLVRYVVARFGGPPTGTTSTP